VYFCGGRGINGRKWRVWGQVDVDRRPSIQMTEGRLIIRVGGPLGGCWMVFKCLRASWGLWRVDEWVVFGG
jgi:hypothetical protein